MLAFGAGSVVARSLRRPREVGVCPAAGLSARRRVVRSLMASPAPLRPGQPGQAVQVVRATEPRVGHGYDLHRLEPGLPFMLGGVDLDHDRGCAAHSDGDAVYHTVVDTILGALSMPDIGQLFSDKDPKWKGASSDVFMKATTEIMHERGYELGNIDVTIILEKPKVAPHKETIRRNIAELLDTTTDRVNVKAKTHEKVDAVGENRAVECHAVAILRPMNASQTTFESQPPQSETETEARAQTPTAQAAVASFTEEVIARASSRVGRVLDSMEDAYGSVADTPQPHTLDTLFRTVESRRGADPTSSWTAKLLAGGPEKIAKKVGEEAVETVIAASIGDHQETVRESADVLYHLIVLWCSMDIQPSEVWDELERREGTSGIKEKASRNE